MQETKYGSLEGSEDPWAYRGAKMHCLTCMWFVIKEKGDQGAAVKPLGRCRRHAPTMNGYPVVFPSDWCGDHKLNENAL